MSAVCLFGCLLSDKVFDLLLVAAESTDIGGLVRFLGTVSINYTHRSTEVYPGLLNIHLF